MSGRLCLTWPNGSLCISAAGACAMFRRNERRPRAAFVRANDSPRGWLRENGHDRLDSFRTSPVGPSPRVRAYVKTNANQVQTYRMSLARAYPVFLSASQGTNQAPDVVSPSVAAYLLFQLLQMKMTQTSYQMDPDTWVMNVEAKRKEAASRPPSRSVVARFPQNSLRRNKPLSVNMKLLRVRLQVIRTGPSDPFRRC